MTVVSSITNGSIEAHGLPVQRTGQSRADSRSRLIAMIYLATTLAMTVAGLLAIAEINRRYAPEMYSDTYMSAVAEAHASGENYGVFDLNIDIRRLREEQFKRLPAAPAITVLGASQWQEAGASLIPRNGYMNAHVHRDYYEDVVGMVEVMTRHDRLPKDLVITIRDRTFTPVAKRTDYLWLPGIPYYQAAAKRFQLEPLTFSETQPFQRTRELISLPMLFANATRWHNAKEWPYPTHDSVSNSLDLLHPDGSITWSKQHQALFTQARAKKLALAHAEGNKLRPPEIDPKGVDALDRVLTYLGLRGVRVHLAHPPFNPIYFEAVRDTPYMNGLREVAEVTRELAQKHKLGQVGSFDPAVLGCTDEMFIDAEHSNAGCLQALLGDVVRSIDAKLTPLDGGSNDISDRLPAASSGEIVAIATRVQDERSSETEATGTQPPSRPVAAGHSIKQPSLSPEPIATNGARHGVGGKARTPSLTKQARSPAEPSGKKRHHRFRKQPAASSETTSRLVWPGDRPNQIR